MTVLLPHFLGGGVSPRVGVRLHCYAGVTYERRQSLAAAR